MKEVWKSVKGYEKWYEVSNTGNVRSLDRVIIHTGLRGNYKVFYAGKLLTPTLISKYLRVHLKRNGKVKTSTIHRLVATAFISNPNNKQEVNHKDGNKLNNNITNLEWCTRSENAKHAELSGRRRNGHKNRKLVKLSEEAVKEIMTDSIHSNNFFVKKYKVGNQRISKIRDLQLL